MKRIWLRVLIAGFTFIIGISSAYLVWFVYSKPDELPPVSPPMVDSAPVTNVATRSDARPAQEEWEELAKVGGCTLGSYYYSPRFDDYDPEEGENFEAGIFYGKRWVAFFRRDKSETVPFLLGQIPNRARSNVHI